MLGSSFRRDVLATSSRCRLVAESDKCVESARPGLVPILRRNPNQVMSVLQGTRDALDGYFKLIVVAPVFVYDAEGLEAFTVNGRLGFPWFSGHLRYRGLSGVIL